MKRDLELIRKILLAVEEWPSTGGDQSFESLCAPEEEVTYNVYQAIEAGLLRGKVHEDNEDMICLVNGLTPDGHDFLDNARNKYIWDEVLADCKKRGIKDASLKIIMEYLNKAVRKKLDDK